MRLTTTTFISVSVTHIPLLELAERHVPVLAALRERDPEFAEVVMKRHIAGLGDWILRTREHAEIPLELQQTNRIG